jgi:hypothetical protein
MTFQFRAGGSKDEVIGQLARLTAHDLRHDGLGEELRDTIANWVGFGSDPAASGHRYVVDVKGSGSKEGVVTLVARVVLIPEQPVAGVPGRHAAADAPMEDGGVGASAAGVTARLGATPAPATDDLGAPAEVTALGSEMSRSL